MGLDMHLHGNKVFWTDWENPDNNRKEDGYKLRMLQVDLGHWHKHYNLASFIHHTFAEDKNVGEVELSKDDMEKIIHAVKHKTLADADSDDDYCPPAKDIATFENAIKWLEEKELNVERSVVYFISS